MNKYDEFYETIGTYSNEYKIEYSKSERRVPLKPILVKGSNQIKNPYVIVIDSVLEISNMVGVTDSLVSWIHGKDTVLIVKKATEQVTSYISGRLAEHDKDIIFFISENGSTDFISNFYNKVPTLIANRQFVINIMTDIDNVSKDGVISGKVVMDGVNDKISKLKEDISKGHNDFRADVIRKDINNHTGRIYKISLKSNSYNFEGQKDKFLDVINDIISLRESNNKVVSGGGVAFKDAANYILSKEENDSISKEYLLAIKLLSEALYTPINTILNNSYKDSNHLDYTGNGMGYNAFKDKDCNMLDSGVVTPLISFIDIIEVIKDVAVAWLVTESAIFTDYNDKGEDKNGN